MAVADSPLPAPRALLGAGPTLPPLPQPATAAQDWAAHHLAALGSAPAVRGCVERWDATGLTGWAVASPAPDQTLALELVCEGWVVARGQTQHSRPDLPRPDPAQPVWRAGFTLRWTAVSTAVLPALQQRLAQRLTEAAPGQPLSLGVRVAGAHTWLPVLPEAGPAPSLAQQHRLFAWWLNQQAADLDAPPALLLLGGHRSGSSALAGALTPLGWWPGPPEGLLPPDRWNPTGYHEAASFMALHDDWLARTGHSWQRPLSVAAAAEPVPTSAWHRLARALAAQLAADQRQQGALRWGFKDPRTVLAPALWQAVLPRHDALLTVRDPLAMAASLHRRDGLAPADALDLVGRYLDHLDAWCERAGQDPHWRRRVVDHDDLLHHPRATLGDLAAWAGLNTHPTALDAAAQALQPRLAHPLADSPVDWLAWPAAARLRERHRRWQATARADAGPLRLAAQAAPPAATAAVGHTTSSLSRLEAPPVYRGALERLDEHGLGGWCLQARQPDAPVALTLWIDGQPLDTLHTASPRRDLVATLGRPVAAGFRLAWAQWPRERLQALQAQLLRHPEPHAAPQLQLQLPGALRLDTRWAEQQGLPSRAALAQALQRLLAPPLTPEPATTPAQPAAQVATRAPTSGPPQATTAAAPTACQQALARSAALWAPPAPAPWPAWPSRVGVHGPWGAPAPGRLAPTPLALAGGLLSINHRPWASDAPAPWPSGHDGLCTLTGWYQADASLDPATGTAWLAWEALPHTTPVAAPVAWAWVAGRRQAPQALPAGENFWEARVDLAGLPAGDYRLVWWWQPDPLDPQARPARVALVPHWRHRPHPPVGPEGLA